MVQKISEALANLNKLEEEDDKLWKEINDIKLPMYLIIEDGKYNYINMIMAFLNNSQKNK